MSNIDLRFTTLKYPLPDFIYEGIKDFVQASNNYFYQPDELRQKIADKHGVALDMIYLTAGADQAINLFAQAYGNNTHSFTPTYIGYSDAKKLGHEFFEHNSLVDDQYRISTNAIRDASLIFLANPNNPAGITKKEDVIRLVENNPNAQVVVDEVYGEMSDESVIDQIERHKNLAVIRSFSKSYSLASFRIGYVIAWPDVLKRLLFDTSYFNIAYPSVGAAQVAIDHEEYFAGLRLEVISERVKTEDFLRSNGYTVVPSSINAVMIRFAEVKGATKLVSTLQENNILVNQGNGASNIGLDHKYVRIGVGTPEQMERLREILAE